MAELRRKGELEAVTRGTRRVFHAHVIVSRAGVGDRSYSLQCSLMISDGFPCYYYLLLFHVFGFTRCTGECLSAHSGSSIPMGMKVFIIINGTEESVFLSHNSWCAGTRSDSNDHPTTAILPAALRSIMLPSSHSLLRLASGTSHKSRVSKDEKPEIELGAFTFHIHPSRQTTWKAVKIGQQCPWRIYHQRVSRNLYRVLLLPRRNVAAFLRDMPDSLTLSSLVLPGTHDTMAFYGWPISQCQSLATPLAVQLQSGIRVIDIRLAVVDGRLLAYHGISPQHATFQSILTVVHDFLSAPETCRETIVMSLKQEDFAKVDWSIFSEKVRGEISEGSGGRDMWFLENRIPFLGEVRGKVVMFSRFGGDGSGWEGGLEGMGIHPSTWPDSVKNGFTWECKGALVRTHDWYNIPSFLSIPEKVTLARQILFPPETSLLPQPSLAITYFSAASFPFAFPSTVALGFGWPRIGLGVEGVNARVGKWLLDELAGGDDNTELERRIQIEPRIRGWVMMDFFQDPLDVGLVPLLIECNFRGRVAGEEGWP